MRLDHLLSKEHMLRTRDCCLGFLGVSVRVALVVFTSGTVDEGRALVGASDEYCPGWPCGVGGAWKVGRACWGVVVAHCWALRHQVLMRVRSDPCGGCSPCGGCPGCSLVVCEVDSGREHLAAHLIWWVPCFVGGSWVLCVVFCFVVFMCLCACCAGLMCVVGLVWCVVFVECLFGKR